MIRTAGRDQKLFYLVFSALILWNVAILASTRLYPFTDVPVHLAKATIFKHYGEPQNEFAHFYYRPDVLRSNVIHMLFCSLRCFPSVEFANKVYFCLYAVLLPLSVFFFIKKTGGNIWFSLLSILFLYNYSTRWGFVEYMFSIPFVLLFCSLAIDYFRRKTRSGALVLAGLLPLIYSMHLFSAMFCVLTLVVFSFRDFRRSWPQVFWTLGLSSGIVALIIWNWNASGDCPLIVQSLKNFLTKGYWAESELRIHFFYADFFNHQAPIEQNRFVRFFFILIAAPFILSFFKVFRPFFAKYRAEADDGYLRSLFLISAACYLFLPDTIPGQECIYGRFSVFIMLFAVIGGSILLKKMSNL